MIRYTKQLGMAIALMAFSAQAHDAPSRLYSDRCVRDASAAFASHDPAVEVPKVMQHCARRADERADLLKAVFDFAKAEKNIEVALAAQKTLCDDQEYKNARFWGVGAFVAGGVCGAGLLAKMIMSGMLPNFRYTQ